MYGSDGVCKITEITQKIFGGEAIGYYILTPVFNNRSTIFVPLKNKKLTDKMQAVMSAENIGNIIKQTEDNPEWIDNDLKRSETFKHIISAGNTKELVYLIKAVCIHKEEIFKKGKKLHKADETTFKDAIRILHEELSLSLSVSKDDIEDIVCKKMSFDDLINKTV